MFLLYWVGIAKNINYAVGTYNRRNKDQLHLPTTKPKMLDKSPDFRLVKIFKKIPDIIKK